MVWSAICCYLCWLFFSPFLSCSCLFILQTDCGICCTALLHCLHSLLQHANEIKPKEHAAPVELLSLCRSQLEYDLYRLKDAIKKDKQSEFIEFRKKIAKSSKLLLKVSRKGAQHRTESYKLTGVYYWLINNQKKAIKWWHKAIEEGKRLGAHLELSRTYFEIGKRLLEPQSKYGMLDGIRADDYLQMARVFFEEMDLQWDLDELSRVYKK